MPSSNNADTVLPLAVTMGDPAGICPELTAMAWQALHKRPDAPVFFAIDDPDNLRARSDDLPIKIIETPEDAVAVFPNALPVITQPLDRPVTAGEACLSASRASIRSIERAVEYVQSGQAGAIVTNPITKKALYDGAGFTYPGHTEFLAALCQSTTPPVMMLASQREALRVIPLTIHIPLHRVVESITPDLLLHTIAVAYSAMQRDFSIAHPRIAIAGLNPHAGEGGTIGTEEKDIILPVIEQARQQGYSVTDPLPADTLFHAQARSTYDCVICMYHDQALIPIKTLDFDGGVNVTLGLPIIRTSPDHGTAYDIAGTGKARATSFINSILFAQDMAHQRSAQNS